MDPDFIVEPPRRRLDTAYSRRSNLLQILTLALAFVHLHVPKSLTAALPESLTFSGLPCKTSTKQWVSALHFGGPIAIAPENPHR